MAKRLVIDASVAISAGEGQSASLQSNQCHDFLTAIMNGDLLVVMTEAIESEWKDPEKPKQTGNSRKWLTRLYARKRIEWRDDVLDVELRDALYVLNEFEYSTKMRLRMLEDVHLLEAALATDHNVVSQDEEVRKLFYRCATGIARVQIVVWVNPAKEENAMEWLQAGCQIEKHRQLGYREQL